MIIIIMTHSTLCDCIHIRLYSPWLTPYFLITLVTSMVEFENNQDFSWPHTNTIFPNIIVCCSVARWAVSTQHIHTLSLLVCAIIVYITYNTFMNIRWQLMMLFELVCDSWIFSSKYLLSKNSKSNRNKNYHLYRVKMKLNLSHLLLNALNIEYMDWMAANQFARYKMHF